MNRYPGAAGIYLKQKNLQREKPMTEMFLLESWSEENTQVILNSLA